MKRALVVVAIVCLAAGTVYGGNGDLIVDNNVGIGTASPGAKLEVAGPVKAGRNYYNVLSATSWTTPTYGFKIKTNIPFQNGTQMPTVIIEGYCYGNAQPIGLTLVWYVYNNGFAQYKASSWGAFSPTIKLSNEDGKVVIFIDNRPYYAMFGVRAYAGKNESPNWFSGWTMVDEAFGGTSQVTVAYENRVNGSFYASAKYFDIRDPRHNDDRRRLVHGSLEGPETGVYYRGEARLKDGRAVVALPSYFEALTRPDGRTMLLTSRFEDSGEPVCPVAASAVRNGTFSIRAYGVPDPARCEHGVYWEVKAERGDVEPLVAEKTQ